MTTVANRPRPTRPSQAEQPPTNPTLAGLYVAVRAACLGLLVVAVPVLVAWATATGSGAGAPEAVRTALQAWLLAQHGGLSTPAGPIGVVPLGLTAVLAVLLAGAGRRGARAARVGDLRSAATLVAVAALAYAVLAALASVAATGAGVRPGPVGSFLGAALLSGGCTGVAVVRQAGLGAALSGWVGAWWRAVLPAAATALGALVATGAGLAGLASAVHLSRSAELTDRLGAGVVGTGAVLLLCLALLPNAVVAGMAYASGVGFGVGTGTVVAPWDVHLGPVPALPLLGGLPTHTVPGLAWCALAGPLVAGVLAGRRLVLRTEDPMPRWRALLGRAMAAGGVTGLGAGVLVALASGPVGAGRLSHVGPTWWTVGPALAAEVGLVAAVVALVGRWRHQRLS